MDLDNLAHPYAQNGRFIVLEGCDGSGTTTQLHQLSKRIFESDKRYNLLLTREPSNGPVGQLIRQMLSRDITINDPNMILSLWQADRYEHLYREVIPTLQAGNIVIQDRYWYSTWCYQQGQGISADEIVQAHRKMPIPDCVLVLNVSPGEASVRRNRRAGKPELFEYDEFQEKVIERYRQLQANFPNHHIHLIDSSQSIEAVTEAAFKIIEPLLPYYQIPMCSPL